MLFNQNGYTPPDSPAGVPLIGYQNVVVSYGATEAATGHPASNLGNPATSSTWQSTTSGAQRIILTMNNQTVNYVGIARHSLFDTTSQIALSYTDNADAAANTLLSLLHFDATSPDMPSDVFTKLLLHCNGTNGSTSFPDSSSSAFAVTQHGNAQVSTAQSEFGGASASFDGTNSYLSIPDSTALRLIGDFTIDFWVRPHTLPAQSDLLTKENAGTISPFLIETATSSVSFFSSSNGSSYDIASGQTLGSIAVDTWTHIAVVRSGNNFFLFNNGVQTSTFSSASAFMQSTDQVIIGARPNLSRFFNGFIDEFRFSNVARWTANFTPPRQFIFDSSGRDEPWASTGTTQIDTSQSKFGGASFFCDTSGAVTAYGGLLAFGTSSFTIDFWVRFSSLAAANFFLVDARAVGSSTAVCIDVETDANSPDKRVLKYFTANGYRITGTTGLVVNTWYHIALCRSGTSTKMFLNGVQEGGTYTDSNDYNLASVSALCSFGGSTITGPEMSGWIDEVRIVSGTGYFTGTFTPPTAPYPDGLHRIFANFSSLLHFDGANGSTTFTDSGGEGHSWLPGAGAHIDVAQSKFGGSSLALGVNDYVTCDGSDAFNFGLGDFTVDFWVRITALHAQNFLYNHNGVFLILTGTGGHINVNPIIFSTATITTGAWHHIAVCRASGTTRLFINGVLDVALADTTNYITIPTCPQIGTPGVSVDGWIDELRIVKGTAVFTRNFVVPQGPAHSLSIRGKLDVDDAEPIIFRFPPISPGYLVLSTSPAFTGPLIHTIGVVYAGQILALERGVKVDVQHGVINYARRSSIVSGMSENGQFLGRVVLAEWMESIADFAWFTPAWYRANFEPFVASAVQYPFFWVWNPSEYPAETAYAWLADDVRPDTDPVTRRMAAKLSMRATT